MAAVMIAGVSLFETSGPSRSADNPYNLIDPTMISVGTMGDAKPYVFTDANGNFTGF
ncbi:transporter substrate-binding domain-containing protein, partial [Mesorhizobium sp. M0019]